MQLSHILAQFYLGLLEHKEGKAQNENNTKYLKVPFLTMENLLHLTRKDSNNVPQSKILTLPNELLTQILSDLPSLQLVRLYTICHRLYSLILHIIHWRIHRALNLDSHHVIFECYTSEKTTTLYLQCAYLGTWRVVEPHREQHRDQQVTVNSDNIGIEAEPQDISNFDPSNIGSLYSHFLPKGRPDSSSNSTTTTLPTRLDTSFLWLDENEPFANLCAQASLVKVGSHWGFFTSVVEVFDEKGILVKREWLRDVEKTTSRYFSEDSIEMRETDLNEESHSTSSSRILWFGRGNVAGLKLRVRESKLVVPVLTDAECEPSAVYVLYYEALLIKTVHLLVTLEQSRQEQLAHLPGNGMAIILGRVAIA